MRGGGPEHRTQQALWLVAEHGVLDCQQAAVLLGVSRPTAYRALEGLVRAGFVERRQLTHGRDHRLFYRLSWSGGRAVTAARRRAGRPPLRELFNRANVDLRQHQINGFFVDLVKHATGGDGRSGLLSWRHRVDACRWLAEQGADDAECDGSGIWVEDGYTVRFTLQWLTRRTAAAAEAIWVCDRFVPLDAVLVVTPNLDDEQVVLANVAARRSQVPVACTNLPILAEGGPAGPVWTTGSGDRTRRRLADLSRQG